MKNTILSVISIVAFVAACAPVKGPDSGGTSVTFKQGDSKEFVAGLQPVKVTVEKDGNEKIAAQCTIESTKYSASFMTPATVNIPAYSQGAVNATLRCTYEEEAGAITYKPINLSKRARNNSSAAVGLLLCPICGIGMAAANSGEKTDDIFGFKELKLEL